MLSTYEIIHAPRHMTHESNPGTRQAQPHRHTHTPDAFQTSLISTKYTHRLPLSKLSHVAAVQFLPSDPSPLQRC